MANRGETAASADDARLVASHAAAMMRSWQNSVLLQLLVFTALAVYVALRIPPDERLWFALPLVAGLFSLTRFQIRIKPRLRKALEANLAVLDQQPPPM